MIRIIDWYIGRVLLATTILCLSVLIGLSSLIKFVEQLRYVGSGNYDLASAGVYVLLTIPADVVQLFPMATMLGGLIGLGMLASSSELVVMQAAGLSRWNIIASAMKSAIIMVIVIMAVAEWVAPATHKTAKTMRGEAISGGRVLSTASSVWAKDGRDFVNISDIENENKLLDITVYRFNEGYDMIGIINAKSAIYKQGKWQMTDAHVTAIHQDSIRESAYDTYHWRSSITPKKLGVVAVKPESLAIQGITEYINYLQYNGQDSSRYELAFWRKATQPVAIMVMLLTALSFIFGPLRSVTMGARVLMGVLTGFGFFVANEVFGPIALIYQLPPITGALLPSVCFAAWATYMLRR